MIFDERHISMMCLLLGKRPLSFLSSLVLNMNGSRLAKMILEFISFKTIMGLWELNRSISLKVFIVPSGQDVSYNLLEKEIRQNEQRGKSFS